MVHLEVRGDTFVNDCAVGLTMVAVVVEMQGEISPLWEISRWRSHLGQWYGVPGSRGTAA